MTPITPPKLRLWRMKKALTVKEAAASIGVDPVTWYRWENGNIRHPVMLAMCLAYLDWRGL